MQRIGMNFSFSFLQANLLSEICNFALYACECGMYCPMIFVLKFMVRRTSICSVRWLHQNEKKLVVEYQQFFFFCALFWLLLLSFFAFYLSLSTHRTLTVYVDGIAQWTHSVPISIKNTKKKKIIQTPEIHEKIAFLLEHFFLEGVTDLWLLARIISDSTYLANNNKSGKCIVLFGRWKEKITSICFSVLMIHARIMF